MFRRTKQVLDAVVLSGVSGEITDHTRHMTNKAVVEMMAGNPYFSFGIQAVEKAINTGLGEAQIQTWMAEALGISLRRFQKDGPSYIDPNLTIERLGNMLGVIDEAIVQKQRILLATGHPGSMLQFFLLLEDYIRNRQEVPLLVKLDKSYRVTQYTWIDSVGSVMVVSDVGSLLHTHDHQPMELALKHFKHKVDLVVADHGFAGGALNSGVKTIGLHDVDDPGIPVAERLGLDILPIPINDNQGNLSTADALEAVINGR